MARRMGRGGGGGRFGSNDYYTLRNPQLPTDHISAEVLQKLMFSTCFLSVRIGVVGVVTSGVCDVGGLAKSIRGIYCAARLDLPRGRGKLHGGMLGFRGRVIEGID